MSNKIHKFANSQIHKFTNSQIIRQYFLICLCLLVLFSGCNQEVEPFRGQESVQLKTAKEWFLVNILQTFMPPPNTSININHYLGLAWQGLEGTSAYEASFPTVTSQQNQQNLAETLKNNSPTSCN